MKNIKKSQNFVKERTIPSEWYATSLLEYLKKIPNNLTENDCEELYKEIENDLKKSIKGLDFEVLSEIIVKLKFANVYKVYYEESKRLLIDVKLNDKSKSIIINDFIPVDIIFMIKDVENESGIFEINTSNFKEKDKNNIEKIKDYEKKRNKENLKLCVTINQFIRKFPNIVRYQLLEGLDIFKLQTNLKFSEKINKYLIL